MPRVLVVDDEAQIRRAVGRALDSRGFDVEEAATGEDALSFAAARAPDLVVLVADAGLGTINSVRLSAGPVRAPVVVHLNRYDERNQLHALNRAWLNDRDRFDVTVTVADLCTRLR